MSDFEEDDEEFSLSGEPYLDEPEYTDEELKEMDAQRAKSASVEETDQPPPVAAAENRERTSGDWWCHCRKCVQMPTDNECFCCREWDLVIPQIQQLDLDTSFQDLDISGDSTVQDRVRPVCITEHNDFSALINTGVLETFFNVPKINWKKRPKPAGLNGQLSVV